MVAAVELKRQESLKKKKKYFLKTYLWAAVGMVGGMLYMEPSCGRAWKGEQEKNPKWASNSHPVKLPHLHL